MSGRKVITPKAAQDKSNKYTGGNPDEMIRKSIQDTLSGISDAQVDFDNPMKQYPSVSQKADESGNKRTVILPAETARQDANDQQDNEQAPSGFIQVDDNRPASWQDKRAADISKIINAYDKASKQRAFRSRQTGTGAASIALSNPAAAAQYAAGRKNYQDQPVDSILGGQKAGQSAAKTQNDVMDLADKDDERDPKSTVSSFYRDYLRKNGVEVPDAASAFDIKRVFPFMQSDIKRDTTERGQDFTKSTADANRTSRQKQGAANRGVKVSQGDKNRGVRVSQGQANRKAGIGKVIIGGALRQDLASGKGTSAAQQKAADSATIPDSFSTTGGFYVKKPGMPPSPEDAKYVKDLGSQAAKYELAMRKLNSVISAPENQRATIFNSNWPQIKTLFATAIQKNIKAMGNGVANGRDIETAVQAIGSPSDIENWIRNGLPQKLGVAMKSVRQEYDRVADARGFQKSDKPSDVTVRGGTGGSQSSRKPLNPATATGANSIANEYGFQNVVGSQGPAASPQTPDIPQMVNFRTTDGTVKSISRKSAEVLQRAQRGQIVP